MKTIKIKPVDSQQLSDRAKFALISIIQENGKDGKPFKLPNEDELASRLNVSRNVLRDALMNRMPINPAPITTTVSPGTRTILLSARVAHATGSAKDAK